MVEGPSSALPDPALRAALFEDAVGALHERRIAPIVELCRAAGPQLLRMQTAKGNTMLHLAPSAVIAEVLLCLGADALALNADGQTPRESAASDDPELVAVLHAAEQDALRRAPAVQSGAAVALAAAEGDNVQVLDVLRQTLRPAEASVAAERCAQLWGALEGQQLVAAEVHFEKAGLTPPRTVTDSPPTTLSGENPTMCPPAQARADVGLEVVQQIETVMGRTVKVVEGLVRAQGDDLAALREELKRFRDDTSAELDSMKEGQEKLAFDRAQASVQSASDSAGTSTRIGTTAKRPSVPAPTLISQSMSRSAEGSGSGGKKLVSHRSDDHEYEDLDDAIPKVTTGGDTEQEEHYGDGVLNSIGHRTIDSPAELVTHTEQPTLEQSFTTNSAGQVDRTVEEANMSGTTTGVHSQLTSEPQTSGGSATTININPQTSVTNIEQSKASKVQIAETTAASVDAKSAENLQSHFPSTELQRENADPTAARHPDPDPDHDVQYPAAEAPASSKPRPTDAQGTELPRHERKALVERHKRVKMVQTMFDKYARRDERSPTGAMGRKELSQLSKDSGSARVDSAYFRDTCEALCADPDIGLLSEHLAQLYLDGGAWSATLASDYKKIFGTKRVKAIAPPVAARPDELDAFVAGSQNDLDDV